MSGHFPTTINVGGLVTILALFCADCDSSRKLLAEIMAQVGNFIEANVGLFSHKEASVIPHQRDKQWDKLLIGQWVSSVILAGCCLRRFLLIALLSCPDE